MTTAPLRVAVVGAGAVGCWFGGLLARSGAAVHLVGRPAHVAAVTADGLHLTSAALDERVPVTAATQVTAQVGEADVILVCVKSADTERVGDELAPVLGGDALVLSLQNGLDNAPRLAARLGRPAEAAVVYVATEMAGPGHVHHHGGGSLVVGRPAAAVATPFDRAGVPVEVVDDVRVPLWAKLTTNCAWNALSAATGRPYGELYALDPVPAVLDDVVAECRAVAAAEGVDLPPGLARDVAALATTMAGQRSSTAQDLARGRRTEIDHLNGVVVRLGRRHGVPTPVNRALLALVRVLEA